MFADDKKVKPADIVPTMNRATELRHAKVKTLIKLHANINKEESVETLKAIEDA